MCGKLESQCRLVLKMLNKKLTNMVGTALLFFPDWNTYIWKLF